MSGFHFCGGGGGWSNTAPQNCGGVGKRAPLTNTILSNEKVRIYFFRIFPGGGGSPAWSLYAPPFFGVCLFFHQTISAFERQINKTRHYTNVACCEVLSSGRLARQAAIQMSFVVK